MKTHPVSSALSSPRSILRLRHLTAAVAAACGLALTCAVPEADAVTAYSVSNNGATLISFDLSTPGTVTTVGNFSGAMTQVGGLDFRPSNGLLYGYNANTNQIVIVNLATAVTTLVSTPTTASVNPDLGMDFNPVADLLRVVNPSDQNLRINADTGVTTVDGPLAYVAGDPGFGASPGINEAAYTNSDRNPGTGTQLFYIDPSRDILVGTTNPNLGELSTIGPLGVNASLFTGFDILSDGLGGNLFYATLTVAGVEGLYSINSATGAASLLGTVNANNIYGLAILPVELFFWTGDQDAIWTTNNAGNTNWATAVAGGVDTGAIPGAMSEVIFSTTSPVAQNRTTRLGANITIKSLAVNDTSPIGIASGGGGPFTLTVAGVAGAGITVATGANLTISANVTLGGTADTITVNGTGVAAISGTLGGANGLKKQGAGTLTLTGTNTYAGGTSIGAGTIRFNKNAALGTGTVTLGDVNTGASATTLLATAPMNSDNGGAVNGGAFTNNLVVSASGTGTVTIGTTVIPYGGGFASTTFSGSLTLNRATTLQAGNADRTTFTGVISGNVGTLTISGGARLVIGGAADNTFVGNVLVTGAGTVLQIGDGANVLTDSAHVDLGAGTTFFLTKSTGAEAINALNGTGTVSTNTGALQTLTVGAGGGTGSFGGVISNGAGQLALVKSGAGVQTLTGANTYSGTTTVSAGKLLANNAIGSATGSGAVTVQTGATLGGAGLIAGPVTVQSGGRLAPGNSPGTLGVGTLVLDSGAISEFELGVPYVIGGASNDLVNVTGNLTIDGTLDLADAGGFAPGVYRLFNYTGTLTDNVFAFGPVPAGFTAGDFSIQTAVPGSVNLLARISAITPVFWDGAGAANDGVIAGGAGTWNAGASNWTASTGHFNTPWTGTTSIFAAPGGLVKVEGTLGFAGLQFMDNGYVVHGAAAAGLTPTGPATITIDAGVTTTFSVALRGGGSVEKLGTGQLVLTGLNDYTGGTTVTGGVLKLGNGVAAGASVGSGNVAIGAGGTFTLDLAGGEVFGNTVGNAGSLIFAGAGANTFTIASGISGAGVVRKEGSNAVTLTGTNTYSGATQVNDGAVQLQGGGGTTLGTGLLTIGDGAGAAGSAVVRQLASEQLGNAAVVLNTDGRYDLNGFTETVSSLAGAAGSQLALGGGVLTAGDAASTTFAGVISGGGTLTKQGAGTWRLSGINTYTAMTHLLGGVLQAGSAQAFGLGSAVTVTAGALDLHGHSQTLGSLAGAAGAVVENTAAVPALLTVGDATSTTFAGTIRNTGGALALAKQGAGVLSLTGTNTYTGATHVNDGAVQLQGGGGTMLGTGALTIGDGVGAAASAIVRQLASEQIGNAAVVVNADGRYDLNGFSETVSSLAGLAGSQITLGSGALTTGDAASTTFAGVISGSGVVTKDGAGTWTLEGANTYTGGTTIAGGILKLGNGVAAGASVGLGGVAIGAAGTFTLDLASGETFINAINDAGALVLTGTGVNPYSVASAISGAGLLRKEGSNVVTLTGLNTYTGATHVNDGGVQLNASGGAVLGTGLLTIGDGVGATGSALVRQLMSDQIGNAAVVLNADGRYDLNGFSETVNSLAGAAGSHISLGSGGALTAGDATNTIFAGVISGSGALTKQGGGAWTLGGANTYTGPTNVHDGALQLHAGGGATLGTGVLTIGDGMGAAGSAVVRQLASDQIGNSAVILNGDGRYDLNGFTETLSSLASAAASSQIFLGSGGALTTGDAASTTFAGVISGSGAQTKHGSGAWTLSGTNSYSGGTTLNAGTLRTQSASALGSGAVTLNAGVLAPSGPLNVGALTWNGGQVQLAPAGGDMINVAGALTNGGGGGTFALDSTGLRPGTYTLATFETTNFTPGSFAAEFSNVPANVTFQSQFLLTGNQVQLSLQGAMATGPLLQNSAPVNIPIFATFLVSGPVQTGGPGESNTVAGLVFTPDSALEVLNTLTVTWGPVDLVATSSLHLNDSTLSASQLRVLPGGLLHGNGTINGSLFNAGLVSPGNSPGQIRVTGSYTQTSTGTLRIEIGGTDAGEYDRLVVAGRAQLDGTLELVPLNDYRLQRGDQITFLTAGQGVDGEFATVRNPFTSETILEPTVVYGEDRVTLELVRGSYGRLAERYELTPNQRAVAGALDCWSAEQPDNKALVWLDGRKLDKLPGDFDDLAPEELTSIFTISTALATVQSINLQRRTDDLRTGASGFSAGGLAMQGTGPGYSGSWSGAAGPSGKESKELSAPLPPDEKKWGAFVTGVGEWVDVSGDGNARGYDITTGGFTLGLDYKLTPNFALGLAAGYAGTGVDLSDDGSVLVNGGKLGLYATYFTGGFYVDAAVNGGYNSYDTKRHALQGTARASTEGGELNVLVGTGYDWKIGALSIGPTATFNYTLVGIDGTTEHGSLAPLDIAGRDAESVRSAFGFKASADWRLGGVLIQPEIRAAWQHEYGDRSYGLEASFASGAGGDFLVHGPAIGRDSLLLGAGFAVQLSERAATYVYYDGELGRDRYDRHSVSGGLRVAF
jgi:autotransporter-associated beta strand protein